MGQLGKKRGHYIKHFKPKPAQPSPEIQEVQGLRASLNDVLAQFGYDVGSKAAADFLAAMVKEFEQSKQLVELEKVSVPARAEITRMLEKGRNACSLLQRFVSPASYDETAKQYYELDNLLSLVARPSLADEIYRRGINWDDLSLGEKEQVKISEALSMLAGALSRPNFCLIERARPSNGRPKQLYKEKLFTGLLMNAQELHRKRDGVTYNPVNSVCMPPLADEFLGKLAEVIGLRVGMRAQDARRYISSRYRR
jgi:hypothetical protein